MTTKKFVVYKTGSIKTVEINFLTGAIAYTKTHCNCKKRRVHDKGTEIAQQEGTTFHRTLKSIPGYKDLLKDVETRKRVELAQMGQADFESYSSRFQSKAIALASLVRYINRYAKCYSRFRNRNSRQESTVRLIYSIKDLWIHLNRNNIVSACLSLKKTSFYTDWEAFEQEKLISNEWVDREVFEVSSTYCLYSYEFDIEGETFKFHSEKWVIDDIHPDYIPETLGSSQPLPPSERIIPIQKAIAMVGSQIGEFDLLRIKNLIEPDQ